MCNPPFCGDVGMKIWSPFLDLGSRSPIFEHLKTDTFGKSAHFWVQKMGPKEFGGNKGCNCIFKRADQKCCTVFLKTKIDQEMNI